MSEDRGRCKSSLVIAMATGTLNMWASLLVDFELSLWAGVGDEPCQNRRMRSELVNKYECVCTSKHIGWYGTHSTFMPILYIHAYIFLFFLYLGWYAMQSNSMHAYVHNHFMHMHL